MKHSNLYNFKVRAVNSAGTSEWSDSFAIATEWKHEKGDAFCDMKHQKKAKNKEVSRSEKKGVCSACSVQ